MDKAVVWFIRMSLIYFFVATILGLGMLSSADWVAYYRTVHVHFNLLGWMSMMIYGVGYHILPKFSGRFIYSPKIMNVQFWFSNLGLVGMGMGWVLIGRGIAPEPAGSLLLVSSVASAIGAGLFVFNLGMTVKPAERPAAA